MSHSRTTNQALSRRGLLRLAGAGLLGGGLAGCAPGSTFSRPPQEPVGPVSTEISSTKPVTLEVWDFQNNGPGNEWTERLNKEFMEAHPNVTVKRVTQGFADLQTKLPLAVTREHPPDVVAVNQGWYPQGALVKGGELLPLDAYADAYGWKDRYPASLLKQHMFADDGSRFGTGSLYGMPIPLAYTVGYFYNQAHLDALGLRLPETFEEFERVLEAARRRGLTPIQLGNLEQLDLFIQYGTILNTPASQEWVSNLVYGLGDVRFDTPASNRAAETLVRWIDRGYFPEAYEGVATTDATRKFSEGDGIFFNQGMSVYGELAALGKDLGFFLLPTREGDKLTASGSAQQNFSVTRRSSNHDVAAAYLDFCSDRHAAEVAAELGLPPLLSVSSGTPESSSFGDLLAIQQALTESDGFVPLFDWATPTFARTLGSASQRLAADRLSPEAYVDLVQEDYENFRETKE